MTKTLLTLALLVAVPAAAQVPFDDLPDQTTLDPTQQILVYDGTITDPLQRQRRMMLRRALDWVLANPTATATETLATIGIGGTVYNFADTDTHVEIRAGAGTSIRMNPAYVLFTGNRVLVSSAGTDGAVVNVIGPLIYSEGTLVIADPTVLDFTGAGVTTTADPVSGSVTIGIPGGGGGMADGVATAGAFNSTSENIDFTVATPGSNFSVDVSALVGGGGGSGDITGITTADTSGLAGGCTSGNCTLTFFPAALPRFGTSEVLARSDDFIFKNESEENSPYLLSFQDFLEEIIGDRMELNANFRSIDVRADYRGVATLTSSDYLTGDIVRESASSARFWLLAGTAGDFTAQEIITIGSGWVRITTGTVAAKAYRGDTAVDADAV